MITFITNLLRRRKSSPDELTFLSDHARDRQLMRALDLLNRVESTTWGRPTRYYGMPHTIRRSSKTIDGLLIQELTLTITASGGWVLKMGTEGNVPGWLHVEASAPRGANVITMLREAEGLMVRVAATQRPTTEPRFESLDVDGITLTASDHRALDPLKAAH